MKGSIKMDAFMEMKLENKKNQGQKNAIKYKTSIKAISKQL